jgi:hypothetical protein
VGELAISKGADYPVASIEAVWIKLDHEESVHGMMPMNCFNAIQVFMFEDLFSLDLFNNLNENILSLAKPEVFMIGSEEKENGKNTTTFRKTTCYE